MAIEETLYLWWQETIEPPGEIKFAQFDEMGCQSFDLKLVRAREHLQAFDTQANAWIDTKPYKAVDEPDPEVPPEPIGDGFFARRFRIYRVNPAPARLGVLIGDCLFNLRSCLDHLALALAQSSTPAMTARQISTSEFPIFDDAKSFQSQQSRKIGCMAPAAQAIIESLQPYQRGNTHATDPLWQIHELNRIDKHRKLLICAAIPPDNFRWCRTPYNVEAFGYFIPCNFAIDLRAPEQDAVVARWSGMPRHRDREMRMELGLPVAVFFGEGNVIHTPVVPLVNSLCDFVGNVVITQLSKFL